MPIPNSSLRGKRCRFLLRVSTLLNDASIDDQFAANKRFADQHGMTHVGGDEKLEGVSGSRTFNRHDLKRLLYQARVKKDYDVLVVYDSSRLTRGGSDHGSSIRRDFAKAGILIQSVMDPVPEGDFKAVMQSLIDTQNNLYSKKLSGFITRGIVSAILRGEVAHHGALPLGIDRLYLRMDGTPFLRLRYVGNGVRELHSEETGKLIRQFHKGIDSGTAYRKQKSEKVKLVPGDIKVVAMIRMAFKMHYVDGVGFTLISRFLQKEGVKPLLGTRWNSSSVKQMLRNPLYLGWDYFLKSAAGLFNMGSADGPLKREDVDQALLEAEERESIPRLFRKRCEMLRTEQPEMNSFIVDPVVRERAEAAISRFFDRHHLAKENEAPTSNGKRHPTSRYFLRGIMQDEQHDLPYAGVLSGLTCKHRYYRLKGVIDFTEPGSILRKHVAAEAVEDVVLDIIQKVFRNNDHVKSIIRSHVARVLDERPEELDRKALDTELKELRDRQSAIYATASASKLREMSSLLQGLELREQKVRELLSCRPVESLLDPAQVMDRVVASFDQLREGMDGQCYAKLHALLRVMIRRFHMGVESREGQLEVWLPEEMLYASDSLDEMCLACKQVHSPAHETHNPVGVKIGVFKLIPTFVKRTRWMTVSKFDWEQIETP